MQKLLLAIFILVLTETVPIESKRHGQKWKQNREDNCNNGT